MLSFIVSFGFTTPQIYSSLDYEDQSGWKRVVKMEVVESRESLFESLLICPLLSAYAYMQYARHGSCLELVKGGLQLARTPAAPEPTSIHFLQWTRVYTFVHCIPI